jgi:dihydroorotate dehydrogenase (NAD+) catalytic subunit
MQTYFEMLAEDLERGSSTADPLVRYDVDMSFTGFRLEQNQKVTQDISILTFDRKLEIREGEFIFVWIPGLGEKPFSVLTDDPFSLAVINVGYFTEKLVNLVAGDQVYVRGPYGTPVSPPADSRIIAVSGGTGLAAVHQIAREYDGVEVFMGARSKERHYFVDETRAHCQVHLATDDGSLGYHGVVTELLREHLQSVSNEDCENLVFFNCGPEAMVKAAIEVERSVVEGDRIFSAVDYLTKCGVGICGACHGPDGRRLCVDGPFLDLRE